MLIIVLMTLSCHSPVQMVKVFASDFHELQTEDNLIPVKIWRTVEADKCYDGLKHANVYKTTIFPKGDTLYVFEFCKKMIWTNADDPNGIEGFVVQISKDTASSFLIPKAAFVPKKADFVFGEILHVER